MKIELKVGEDCNSQIVHELWINDVCREYISSFADCPEDACIGRELIDGNDIIKYIKMGYEAAKKEETLSVKYTNSVP